MRTESSSAGIRGADEPDRQAGLRRDISELSAVLGRTLVRQEGADLLDLFERVRLLIDTDHAAAADLLSALDTVSATRLVRAFATYFHLANVAEQVHRGRELAAVHRQRGTWLSQAVDQIAAAEFATSDIAAGLRQVALRPVFTAHPTEAARRSVLTKIQQIAGLLDEWDRALGPGDGPPDRVAERRVRRRLEELVDLLWQTDASSPPFCWRARPGWSTSTPAWRGSASSRCWRRSSRFGRRTPSSPRCSRSRPTGASSRCAVTCRRSCSATRIPTRRPV